MPAVFAAMASPRGRSSCRHQRAGHAIDVSQIEAAATLAGAPVAGDAVSQIVEKDGVSVAVSTTSDMEAPVLQLEDTDAAPAFADCDGWLPASHPFTGDEALVAAPWRVNGARPRLRKAAPILGEADDYVLTACAGVERRIACRDTNQTALTRRPPHPSKSIYPPPALDMECHPGHHPGTKAVVIAISTPGNAVWASGLPCPDQS